MNQWLIDNGLLFLEEELTVQGVESFPEDLFTLDMDVTSEGTVENTLERMLSKFTTVQKNRFRQRYQELRQQVLHIGVISSE